MGQYWLFSNFDKQERTDYLGKFGEFFDREAHKYLIKRLYRPGPNKTPAPYFKPLSTLAGEHFETDYPKQVTMTLVCTPFGSRADTLGVFSILPIEVIEIIVRSSGDIVDTLCLAFTSQYFWEICRPIMNRAVARKEVDSMWYGDRIMCVGDCAEEPPEGLFTTDQAKALLEEQTVLRTEEPDRRRSDSDESLSLPELCEAYPEPQSFDFQRDVYQWFLHRMIRNREMQKHVMSFQVYYTLLESHRTAQQEHYHVLRNLSKKMYVREEIILKLRERTHAFIPEDTRDSICLASALLMRIAWSACGFDDRQTHRGVWAGDRFDVVDNVDFDDEEPGWIDVSAAVAREVIRYVRHHL